MREKLRLAIKHALKQCPLSRVQVAGEMSHLIGDVEVTRFMLDTWTAESKEGHRFPAEYLPGFLPCDRLPGALGDFGGGFGLVRHAWA